MPYFSRVTIIWLQLASYINLPAPFLLDVNIILSINIIVSAESGLIFAVDLKLSPTVSEYYLAR